MRFVSLGSDCEVASNIRRCIPGAQSGFFDWIITPIQAVESLVLNGFTGFLQDENLEPIWSGAKLRRVMDRKFDIVLIHQFDTAPKFDQELVDVVRGKYLYQAGKFTKLLEGDDPVCFIRKRLKTRDDLETEATAWNLFQLLASRRKNVYFLYCHPGAECPLVIQGCFASIYLPPHPQGHWAGNLEAWDELLQRFNGPAAWEV